MELDNSDENYQNQILPYISSQRNAQRHGEVPANIHYTFVCVHLTPRHRIPRQQQLDPYHRSMFLTPMCLV
jgi:hypothetical protein